MDPNWHQYPERVGTQRSRFLQKTTQPISDVRRGAGRKSEPTSQPNEVLLDENLVETIWESALFVRKHPRKFLQGSVWNDTM